MTTDIQFPGKSTVTTKTNMVVTPADIKKKMAHEIKLVPLIPNTIHITNTTNFMNMNNKYYKKLNFRKFLLMFHW